MKGLFFLPSHSAVCLQEQAVPVAGFWVALISSVWTVISCVPGWSDLPVEHPTMVLSGMSPVQGSVDLITVILGILRSWGTHLNLGLQSLHWAPGLPFPPVTKHFWEADLLSSHYCAGCRIWGSSPRNWPVLATLPGGCPVLAVVPCEMRCVTDYQSFP